MAYRATLRGERFSLRRPARPARQGERGEVRRPARRHRRRAPSASASPPSSPWPTCRSARSSTTRRRSTGRRHATDPATRHDRAAFAASSRALTVGEFRELLLDADDATLARSAGRARHAGGRRGGREADEQQGPGAAPRARSATSRAAATRSASAACSACACSRTTRPTTSPASCWPRSTGCSSAAATRSSASTRRPSRSRRSRRSCTASTGSIDAPRHPDAGLLPGPHHHAARRARPRRAGRSAVPVGRRHAGGQRAASASRWRCCSEGRERVLERHRARDVAWVGEQVMYFETGQGSALSADAHHGVDQLTLEARAYGVARAFDPFLVNSVVGFIGPEYLFDERQIMRAGLEDHFIGKLLGLPMGVRRLLHQPRRRRPELRRQPAAAARGGRGATTSWACRAPTT